MFRLACHLSRRSLHISKRQNFSVSLIRRSMKDTIFKIPCELVSKGDVSFAGKDLTKMTDGAVEGYGTNIPYKQYSHAAQERLLIYIPSETYPELLDEDLCEPPELVKPDFQQSKITKDSSILHEFLDKCETEVLSATNESKIPFDSSESPGTSDVTDFLNLFTKEKLGVNSQSRGSKKKRKAKKNLTLSSDGVSETKDDVTGSTKKENSEKNCKSSECDSKEDSETKSDVKSSTKKGRVGRRVTEVLNAKNEGKIPLYASEPPGMFDITDFLHLFTKEKPGVHLESHGSKKKRKAKKNLKLGSDDVSETKDDVKVSAKKENSEENLKSECDFKADSKAKGDMKSSARQKSKKKSKSSEWDSKDLKTKVDSGQKFVIAKEAALNKQYMLNLKSYINVCLNSNMSMKALEAFYFYRSKKSPKFIITDIEVYDALISEWAQKGELKAVKEIFECMKKDGFSPSLQSYASYLECLSRNNMHGHPDVKWVISSLEQKGFNLEDLLLNCKFAKDQVEKILDVIGCEKPDFDAYRNTIVFNYSCKLLEKLNSKTDKQWKSSQPSNSIFTKESLNELAACQMEVEEQCFLKIKVVNAVENVSEKILSQREEVKKYEELWRTNLSTEFRKGLCILKNKIDRENKCTSLYPYLVSVDPKIIVNLMLREIRFLAENCETFSPNIKILYCDIARKVMNHYFMSLKKKNKIDSKILHIYSKYSEYLVSPELSSKYSPREYWELLKLQEFKGPTIDDTDLSWSHHILCEVGKFIYNIIFEGTGFYFTLHETNPPREFLMPVFCSVPVNAGTHLSYQVRVHHHISQLYRKAELEDLYFDASVVPMMCPPRPWNQVHAGGSLVAPTPFIRLPYHAPQTQQIYRKIPSQQLSPCFDSLNVLSLCPWIINKPMLDLVVEVFRNNGCEELDIPVNPKYMPLYSEVKEFPVKRSMAAKEHKKRCEMASLWYDCLYKLTIANYFRDKVFWFPHNLDFRGRVYPTPPHFNHLGSDMVRSILLFAEGKPLGKNGLDWLKIHLINLTGFKKRDPLSERLKFADEMLPEILDSADNPFTGNQWWKTSDNPWQTLACCKEVASVVRSPDQYSYISHFPIHQDGSCNGLQHYAALGRDELGAHEVNLHPADSPNDVYSAVASLVEKERIVDAVNGSEIAQALEGLVQRKVVKQTVMTYVYGVTRFGAKLQILKQLKDIAGFPEDKCKEAIGYLSAKIFLSIEEMFTATQQIQNWFTECAEVITKNLGEPVEWVTPLGLPVVQPYHREVSVRGPSDLILWDKELPTPFKSTFETSQLPNVMKQKNAFPPNFIHSLDSSHMMLTALFCHRKGITFVSVHDCFWTHSCTVEIMNRVCREQFVSLHSEPILEQLSEYFVKRYLGETIPQDNSKRKTSVKLLPVLKNVPEKGTFKLEKVLDSVYFFS